MLATFQDDSKVHCLRQISPWHNTYISTYFGYKKPALLQIYHDVCSPAHAVMQEQKYNIGPQRICEYKSHSRVSRNHNKLNPIF